MSEFEDLADISSDEEVPQGSDMLSSLMGGLMKSKSPMTSSIPLTRGTVGSAAYDFKSTISCVVTPHTTVAVDTGVCLDLAPGYYMQLLTRSSSALRNKTTSASGLLSTKDSIIILAGVIDEDYKAPIKVLIHNLGITDYRIEVGDKIAQGVIFEVGRLDNEIIEKPVDFVHEGFGSTGR